MKKILLLVSIFFMPECSFAQTQITNLLAGLNNAKTDTQKVEAYKGLIAYYATENPDSENWYVNEGIQYFKGRNFKLGIGMILSQAGVSDENHGRVDLGKQRTEEALKIFRAQKYLAGVAEMIHNLGATEASKGNFDVATMYFVNALKVYDSVTDYHGLLLTCMNLGELYLVHSDTANAWKYLMLADSISKKTPVTDATVFLHNIIGAIFAEEGHQDTALKMFISDLKMSDKPGLVNSHIESLLYISDFYGEKGDDETALRYLTEGLELAKKNSILEMEANFLMEIAHIKEKSDLTFAINYLTEAQAISEKIHSKAFLANIYSEMDTVYKLQGNYRDALRITEAKQKIVDSLFNIDKTREIEKIDAAYELEKNKKIKQLEDLNKKNTNKRNVIIVVAGIMVLILFVLSLYFRKSIILNRKLAAREKELQELNNMKDKLFSIIGHDLRSPLTQIPAILEIYDDPETSEEEKKFMFEHLKEHSNASLETLDKLLLWGKSLVKGIGLTPVKFLTKKLVRENIELKKTAALEKKIAIVDNTADDIFVFCDATHFDFIIRNLLANAIKYTNAGGNVEINSRRSEKPGFIVFEVKDNGVGVAKESMANIFNPLNSMEGTAHEKGAGIGLMLCKEFVLKNGGEIWVTSEVGKGTSFYFSVKSAE